MWPNKEVLDARHIAVKRCSDSIEHPRHAVHSLAMGPGQDPAALPVPMERGLRCDSSLDLRPPDEFTKGGHGTHRQPGGNHSYESEFIEVFLYVQIQESGKPARGGGRQAGGIGVGCKGVQLVLPSLFFI